MSQPLTIPCPAKVNLALSVGGPTPDGYHPIASWMVAIDLADELTLERADGDSTYDIAWSDDALRPSPIDWPLESDLIVKAHRLVEAEIGRPLPARATLRKRIPVGAGLAGGSTDGAAMLKALRQLFDLELTDQKSIDLSMQIGSDLAFFFSSGSAIVTGRGEGLREAPIDEPIHLCLILPEFGCPPGRCTGHSTNCRRAPKSTCPPSSDA
jgi:4-diphosphocytidyl-2-C-methyl-D-erythritol kinase